MNLRIRFILSLQFLEIVGVILYPLRILHVLEIVGGRPQWVKPIKPLDSREVSVEEFLEDIFKSKRKYFCALIWKYKSLPLFKRLLIYQIMKNGWMS